MISLKSSSFEAGILRKFDQYALRHESIRGRIALEQGIAFLLLMKSSLKLF